MDGFLLVTVLLLGLVATADAEDDELPEIRSLHVISDIRYRFVKTLIQSRIANPANVSAEVEFKVTIPNTAFITGFQFLYEGRLYKGKVEDREAAKKKYTAAKDKGDAAGHVTKSVLEMNEFKVALNIPAHGKISVNVTYEEILERRHGVYKHVIYIDPGQPVPELKIDVAIQESRDITVFKVPPISENAIVNVDITRSNTLAVIQRPDSKSAYIRFYPSLDEQLDRWSEGISGHFIVLYDVKRGFDAGDVLVSNGYFVHFFAPVIHSPILRDVLFILDTSTSMLTGKLTQLRSAMEVILKELHPDDRFNIITFGSMVKFWQPDMAEVKDKTNIQRALNYMDTLKALGWTNIKKSLVQGITYLNEKARSTNGALIIFLTDGEATSGEINHGQIQQAVMAANTKSIPVYTLAFGKNADWDLMKKVALQNGGFARRIYMDGSAAQQIEGFYLDLSTTMLRNVTFKYAGGLISRLAKPFSNYFEGSELIIAGQVYEAYGTNITAVSEGGGFGLQLSVSGDTDLTQFHDKTSLYGEEGLDKMVERMWAYLYIRHLLIQRVKNTDRYQRDRLKNAALKRALQYNFITSLTSMVVDQPSKVGVGNYNEDNDMFYIKEQAPEHVEPSYNRGGWGSGRGGGGGDPHFMVFMKGLEYPICFDVKGEDRKIYQFIHDPQADLTVNIRMGKGNKTTTHGGFRMYIVEITIIKNDLHLLVTRDNISMHDTNYSWNGPLNTTVPGARLVINSTRLSVIFNNRFQIDISNHIHPKANLLGGNFLNIELGNEELLSTESDGILGQFIHKKITLSKITYHNDHLVGHLKARSGQVVEHGRARLRERNDPYWKEKTMCWMLGKREISMFDAPPQYYIVSDMDQTQLG